MTDALDAWEARVRAKEALVLEIHGLLDADRAWKRSRAYRTPPPVYATCPACRAWVRVLPSGRCDAGGRMRS